MKEKHLFPIHFFGFKVSVMGIQRPIGTGYCTYSKYRSLALLAGAPGLPFHLPGPSASSFLRGSYLCKTETS